MVSEGCILNRISFQLKDLHKAVKTPYVTILILP